MALSGCSYGRQVNFLDWLPILSPVLFQNGENALHYGCRCSNYELSKQVIEFLVKSGLPIDSQNKVILASFMLLLVARLA